jgi:hypothetical protein
MDRNQQPRDKFRKLKAAGCGIIAITFLILIWRAALAGIGILAAVCLVGWIQNVWKERRVVAAFRRSWQASGKDMLLIYSNSPHWKDYVEQQWLPRWGSRAVVVNWSERLNWKRDHPIEAALFGEFAGSREFNPLAIVVPEQGRKVRLVRFWLAFRDFKHGKPEKLRAAEAELDDVLKQNSTGAAK